MAEGVITAAFGRQFYVAGDDGRSLVCVMRGKRNDAAVGDRVRYAPTGGGGGVIDEVLPRRTLLARSDRRRTRLFAANLTQIAVVMAPDPPPSEELLMRALIAAHEARLPAAIVLNKADLLDGADRAGRSGDAGAAGSPVDANETGSSDDAPASDTLSDRRLTDGPSERQRADAPPDRRQEVTRRVALYESLGVPVMRVAAKADPSGTRAVLMPWLRDQVTLLLGQSGMGKSTLINLLAPEAAMATQAISQALATGRHTTTFARSFALPAGGVIIDSPGFQEFGLEHLSLSQVQAALPDFAAHLGDCRFHNCTHRSEPGCAVRAAVQAGRIDARRHALYVQLADHLTRPAY